MNKCGEIFNECENAIGVALRTLLAQRPGYFLLFLARGEYNPIAENNTWITPYLLDYRPDIDNIHYQQEFIIHYLNRNYKKDGFEYAKETDVDDMIIEMLIYSHVWEDVGFLKLLVRLSGLLNGEDYQWETDLEYHNELYTTIQTKVIQPLQKQKLALGDLIQSAYSSHIRDAFAHSMYSIDYDSRKIRLWGGRREDKKWNQELSFDEFQVKFLKTIRIWNQLYHLCEECRKLAATQNLTGEVPLPDGRKLRIRAEWIERGGVPEPNFKGIVIKRDMRILEVSRYKKEYVDHQLPFVTEQGESLRAAGCEVEYFLVRGNYITAVKALKAKIREFKPDVIHAHFGLSAITAELQSLVPVVTTFHNGETLNWHVNLLSSLFSLRAKHVIYVAQHIRDLSYFKAKNYSIIPCGVSLEDCVVVDKAEARKKLGWDVDKKYILFGGAFSNTRKNYQLLRSAVELLYENYKENTSGENINYIDLTKKEESTAYAASSVIANQSANEQDSLQPNCQSPSTDTDKSYLLDSYPEGTIISLQKTQKIFSSEHNWMPVEGGEQFGNIICVEMKGLSRAECVLRMNACDLFALPSHSEGSPQALKEAMAVNCPCLATDIADVRELFGNEPGHLVLRNPRKTHERWDADENSLNDMVELLKEALAFEGRTNGRKRIIELELSNEQVAKRLIKIYEQILKKQ